MKVIWKKPIDENGIIREYRLEYCNKNCNVSILLGNITEAILFGLIPDSNYSFKVCIERENYLLSIDWGIF